MDVDGMGPWKTPFLYKQGGAVHLVSRTVFVLSNQTCAQDDNNNQRQQQAKPFKKVSNNTMTTYNNTHLC